WRITRASLTITGLIVPVGRITTVGVSKLRVGNSVGKGVRVGAGVAVDVSEAVGVSEPAGVQVIKTRLSAPLNVRVIVGACPNLANVVVRPPHRQSRKNSPTPPIINFKPGFCWKNQLGNWPIVFMSPTISRTVDSEPLSGNLIVPLGIPIQQQPEKDSLPFKWLAHTRKCPPQLPSLPRFLVPRKLISI